MGFQCDLFGFPYCSSSPAFHVFFHIFAGRVKESPRAKGVLIPSINIVPATPETSGQQATTDSRISIRVVKSADESDN